MDGPALTPAWIESTAPLDALSYADAIEIYLKTGEVELLCLTHLARVVFGEEDNSVQVETADRVLDVLARTYGRA